MIVLPLARSSPDARTSGSGGACPHAPPATRCTTEAVGFEPTEPSGEESTDVSSRPVRPLRHASIVLRHPIAPTGGLVKLRSLRRSPRSEG